LDIVCNLWQNVQTPFWTTKGHCQDTSQCGKTELLVVKVAS
jgi:hypothetical protein